MRKFSFLVLFVSAWKDSDPDVDYKWNAKLDWKLLNSV